MPLYEYECAGCGKRFELIQKFSAPPEATCLVCGGRAHRLLSPPALQFKGSGWYITDYARKSSPAAKSEGAAEAAASTADKEAASPAKKESE